MAQQQDPQLPYDIYVPAQRAQLTSILQKWIDEDNAPHINYVNELNECDDRLNGTVEPAGFTQSHIVSLAQSSSNTISDNAKSKTKSFVHAPQTRPIHEAHLGDFAQIRRKLTIRGNNPTDANKAKVYQKRVEFIENVEMLPEQVYFPAMDQAWGKGLMWIEGGVNPFARELRGKQTWDVVSARDVLVDNHAQGMFFNSARRNTRRIKMEIQEAKDRFTKYPLFRSEQVNGDNDYDQAWGRNTDRLTQGEFATFYNVQWWRWVCKYVFMNDKDEPVPITAEQYATLMMDANSRDRIIQIAEDKEYYIALYSRHTGVFHLQYNPAGMFTRIPLVNISSDSRLYPMGDVKVSQNLQDLLDVLMTVLLENMKKANKPILEVAQDLISDPDALQMVKAAGEHGGVAPGLTGVHNVQPINNYLVELIPLTLKLIQDASSRHDASSGQLPTKQIAKDTVIAIQASDRKGHGRKDVMLKWTLTMVYRLMCKYIGLFDSESDFFPLNDAMPGQAGYIPINKLWTVDEYITNLAQMYGIQPPKAPNLDGMPDEKRQGAAEQHAQADAQFEMQFEQIKMQFESENDVKPVMMDGYIVQGREMSADQLTQTAKEIGMTLDEFVQKYQPQQAQIQMVKINDLTEDADLSIIGQIDNDYQNDPQYKENRAFALFDRKAYASLDLYKDLNIADPEAVHKRAIAENQAMQLALEISKDEKTYSAVMQVVNKIKSKTKEPAPSQE